MPSRMDSQRPDRVPAFMPFRLPAVLTSWQGEPPVKMWTGSTRVQSTFVMSPRFGTSGQWYSRMRLGASSYSQCQTA